MDDSYEVYSNNGLTATTTTLLLLLLLLLSMLRCCIHREQRSKYCTIHHIYEVCSNGLTATTTNPICSSFSQLDREGHGRMDEGVDSVSLLLVLLLVSWSSQEKKKLQSSSSSTWLTQETTLNMLLYFCCVGLNSKHMCSNECVCVPHLSSPRSSYGRRCVPGCKI